MTSTERLLGVRAHQEKKKKKSLCRTWSSASRQCQDHLWAGSLYFCFPQPEAYFTTVQAEWQNEVRTWERVTWIVLIQGTAEEEVARSPWWCCSGMRWTVSWHGRGHWGNQESRGSQSRKRDSIEQLRLEVRAGSQIPASSQHRLSLDLKMEIKP